MANRETYKIILVYKANSVCDYSHIKLEDIKKWREIRDKYPNNRIIAYDKKSVYLKDKKCYKGVFTPIYELIGYEWKKVCEVKEDAKKEN